MNYKSFITERSYFAQTIPLFNKMIVNLKQQLNGKKQIKVGEEFVLFFGDDDFAGDVTVKFYKGYSQNALDYFRDKELNPAEHRINAMYYPVDYELERPIEKPTIEVYLSKFIKDRRINLLEFIKQMKEPLPALLRHELSHAYEDSKISKDGVNTVYAHTGSDRNAESNSHDQNYANNISEMNAWFQTWIPTLIQKEKLLQNYLYNGKLNEATLYIVNKIKGIDTFQDLYTKNKNWFYKTIYMTLSHILEQ